MQWARDGYLVTDEPERIDAEAVYAFLCGSYWAKGLPRAVFERSLRGSLCLGLLHGRELAGFCRASPPLRPVHSPHTSPVCGAYAPSAPVGGRHAALASACASSSTSCSGARRRAALRAEKEK